jgi:hypothetical protein
MAIHYPPVFINRYLQDKIPNDSFDNELPFFPTNPTTIDELTETFPDGMFAVYDRMFKFRRGPFPHIKCEQLLYYFYKVTDGPEKLIETVQYVYDLLDRGDESAQELNNWIAARWRQQGRPVAEGHNIVTGKKEIYKVVRFGNPKEDLRRYFEGEEPRTPEEKAADQTDFLIPYFHQIKIFQLEEARDIIDFGTARTYAGNKLIIDYDWHASDPIKE